MIFHGYATKRTSTKKALVLVPVKNKNSWHDHADFPKYFRNIWLLCKATAARWEPFPRTVWWPGDTLASRREAEWLLGKPEQKNFRDWSAVSLLSECQDYYLVGKQSHKCLLSPLQDNLLQPWAAVVHSEDKGGKNTNVDSLRGNYAALEGTDTYKQLWWEETEVLKPCLSSNTSLGLFMKLLKKKALRELCINAKGNVQGLEKLWETWRINTTVMPEISPPCT